MLVQWIRDLDSQGHAPTPAQVREMVQAIRASSGIPEPIPPLGHNWFTRFRQRNPEVSMVIGKTPDTARVQGTSRNALSEWFTRFYKIVTEHRIQPQNIYNIDETGLSIGIGRN